MSVATRQAPLLLNVDDNDIALYAKTRTLRHAGYEVMEASTGIEGLRLVADHQPTLVLLDVKLPDISGLEVCRQIKQDWPDTLVLQISASYVQDDDMARGLEGGADSYVTQPVAPNALVAAVRALLRIRAAEGALRASEARLQAVLASATDYAIISLDDTGRVTGWNAGATGVFGWQENEALGRHVAFAFTEDDRRNGVPAQELETARATGRAEDTRWMLRHDGMRFFANGVMTRLSDGTGGYVKILRDQTQQLIAEDALRELNTNLEARVEERTNELAEANQRLQQSQKMEALGQLTGGIAHDFNNLLQIVIGGLELVLRALPKDNSRTRRAAENAMTGSKRAASLTNRLLAFARQQPLMPRLININELITGMSDLLNRALGETIALRTDLALDLWSAEADPNQLETAILNLAVNAHDAMQGGGELTIATRNARLDEAFTEQMVEMLPGLYVVIAVTDTGTGMDEATLQRVFEPFFTTKEVGRGTGLGLSMVYGFVKQSGGHVTIDSDLGQGTTVTFYLPRAYGSATEDIVAQVDKAPGATASEIILVVEDDDDVRAYSVDTLRELGYEVLEARDGESALDVLRTRLDTAIRLLFTDVVLPGSRNGEELAAEARVLRPDLKVLFTTGYVRDAVVHQGRVDPGVDVITKPFSYADIAAKIREVLDRR
jgi:PAS domain S-box-containing protein